MIIEQKIRAVLFYSSVLIFFGSIPFIISSALGYKFDRRSLRFTKTGLILLKTQPQGASVYLDGKLLDEKTPLTLREIFPGTYNIKLELAKHYPWLGEVKVGQRKVTILDKIVLFPLRPNIKQINEGRFNTFLTDKEKSIIYYIDYGSNNIYSSDLEGAHYKKCASFIGIKPFPVKWKLSPDREKLLYFNRHQIGIVYFEPRNERLSIVEPFILDYPAGLISEVFWYSDSYHLIVVSEKKVEAMEAKLQAEPIELAVLNKRNTTVFYNNEDDTLFFIDSQRAIDGEVYENLYKLELNTKVFPFLELIKLNHDE